MIWGKRNRVATNCALSIWPFLRRIQIKSSIQELFSLLCWLQKNQCTNSCKKRGTFLTFHQITSISSNWKKGQFHESNSRWILPWLFLINGKVKIIKRITCNSGSIMKIHAKNKWIFNDPIHHGLKIERQQSSIFCMWKSTSNHRRALMLPTGKQMLHFQLEKMMIPKAANQH